MSLEIELKNLGTFYSVDSLDNQSIHFKVIYHIDNNEYLKVYNKKTFIDQYRDPIHNGIDRMNILLKFFKKNKYHFLSEFKYETENYIIFKYYHNYKQSTLVDFVDLSIEKMKKFLNIKTENKNHNITEIFKIIIKNFKKMYENEKIDIPFSNNAKEFSNFKSKSKLLDYLTITPSSFTLSNILFKKDKNGNIKDWKYVDMENIDICFPRYIFNLNEDKLYPKNNEKNILDKTDKLVGDDSVNLQYINEITDKPSILYTLNAKWYNLGEIKNC